MTDCTKHRGRYGTLANAAIRLAFSSLMSLALVGCAEDELGSKWETETGATSPIRFVAPGLAGGIERYFSTQGASRTYTEHVAIRIGPGGEYPRAEVIFVALAAGYGWRREVNLTREVAGWTFFSEEEVKIDSVRRTTNDNGVIRYAPFTYRDVSCVAFTQTWGFVDGMKGNRLVVGYYCGEPDSELSSATISEVLQGIRVAA